MPKYAHVRNSLQTNRYFFFNGHFFYKFKFKGLIHAKYIEICGRGLIYNRIKITDMKLGKGFGQSCQVD